MNPSTSNSSTQDIRQIYDLEFDASIHGLIKERVLSGLNHDDKYIRKAAKEVLSYYDRALSEPEQEVVHKIVSDEVIDSIVACHKCAIELEAAERRMRICKEKNELARRQVIPAIHQFEDIESTEQWALNLFQLVLIRADQSLGDDQKIEEILKIASLMADKSSIVPLSRIKEGNFPKDWNAVLLKEEGVRSLFSELAEYLIESGESGKNKVRGLLKDKMSAVSIAYDEEEVKAVRALAAMVLYDEEES